MTYRQRVILEAVRRLEQVGPQWVHAEQVADGEKGAGRVLIDAAGARRTLDGLEWHGYLEKARSRGQMAYRTTHRGRFMLGERA